MRRKKYVICVLVLCMILSSCGKKKYCDHFVKEDYSEYCSSESIISVCDPILINDSSDIADIRLEKVAKVDVMFDYDWWNDDILIDRLYVFDRNGKGGELSGNSYYEIDIEWWHTGYNSIFVDEIFILGEDGYYIFEIGDTIFADD